MMNKKNWLGGENVSLGFALGAAAAIWLLVVIFMNTSLSGYVVSRFIAVANFKVREELGLSPSVSDKLKIIGVDDRTLSLGLESWVMSLDEWDKALGKIAQRRPKAIFIDAFLSKVSTGQGAREEKLSHLGGISSQVPIYTGVFLKPNPIKLRQVAPLRQPWNAAENYRLRANQDLRRDGRILPDLIKWFAYGPEDDLQSSFSRYGHLQQREGRTAPVVWVGEETLLPTLGLLAAESIKIDRNRLLIDSHPVALGRDGEFWVNFPALEKLQERTISMLALLDKARADEEYEGISAGDTVLIIPQLFTGNTDFKMTPIGSIPGGYIHAAVINSVLNGSFVQELDYGEILVLLAVIAGAGIGFYLRGFMFWLAISSTVVGQGICFLVLFATANIFIEWFFPMAATAMAGLAVFAEATRVNERKTRLLRQALEGAVSSSDLKLVIKNPDSVRLEAKERVVTVMFIDIVGFSAVAERLLPRVAFDNLKTILQSLTEVIHENGGVVDKTLGDGLLCYFGYVFGDDERVSTDHAERAMRCAIKIQEESLLRGQAAAARGEPIFPLRIGVNSASCYLGDMGSAKRIDFTVVGNGVNFAKRLEAACTMYCVTMSETTKDLVMNMGLASAGVNNKLIKIKHHLDLVPAFEFDPFFDRPGVRTSLQTVFEQLMTPLSRAHRRWPVIDPNALRVSCEGVESQVKNLSYGGVALKSSRRFEVGSMVELSFNSPDGNLGQKLTKMGLGHMHGEVRWVYVDGQSFVHGIALRKVSDEQGQEFLVVVLEKLYGEDRAREFMEMVV